MRSWLLIGLTISLVAFQAGAIEKSVRNGTVHATLNTRGGEYIVSFDEIGFTFHGRIGAEATNVSVRKGADRVGSYQEIAFRWSDTNRFGGSIRVYGGRRAVLFTERTKDSLTSSPPPFPMLRVVPSSLHMMTYSEREFGSPPRFSTIGEWAGKDEEGTSGPVALFDDHASTCIVSPASDFMVAWLSQGKDSSLASGLRPGVLKIPAGYTYQTVLVGRKGINAAWETWGRFLTDHYGKKRPANDADVGLRYLGYWTDNGATYYYNYDTTKGYEATLLAEKSHLDSVRIPIRYFQLDSWWYLKGFTPPDGKIPDHPASKIARLPEGEWNRYGGLIEYVPAPELFPHGLKSFRDHLGVPLITHNRWIERESPYRKEFHVSGIGAVDYRWWDKITSDIASWGVTTYEQDWLNMIYRYSPEFQTTTWAADSFFDNMSKACSVNGLTMQYCMALPGCYLQGGAKYSNLTTIRVSDDRFEREHWLGYLYGSRLSSALGVWPWVDVFMSSEKDNLLLATLSAGMVGIGDEYGKENPSNIAYAVRPDGVIVKPDIPLVPTDATFLADVKNDPACRTAWTFSKNHRSRDGGEAVYLFSYNHSKVEAPVLTRPCDIGMAGRIFIYDFFEGVGRLAEATDSMPGIRRGESSYAIIVPVNKSGIALVGDPGKFITRGRQRIAEIMDLERVTRASVVFAKSESNIDLLGYARSKPVVTVSHGKGTLLKYDPQSGQFTIRLFHGVGARSISEHGDAVTRMSVSIALE